MFKKKENKLEDNITHSTVKLLLEKFKFLSLNSKIALLGGIIICILTLIFTVVLAFVLPNTDWPAETQEKWLASVGIIRWIGIGVVGVGFVFTFLDIFKNTLPETFEKEKKNQKPKRKPKKVNEK